MLVHLQNNMTNPAFEAFRLARDEAIASGASTFVFNGNTYRKKVRRSNPNFPLWKKVTGSRRASRRSARRRSKARRSRR